MLQYIVDYPYLLLTLWFVFCCCLFVFAFGSQPRGQIGAATGLHHSHSNAKSEPCLWPTYTTAHDNTRSLTHWAKPGIEPATSWFLVRFISTTPRQELSSCLFYEYMYSKIVIKKSIYQNPKTSILPILEYLLF